MRTLAPRAVLLLNLPTWRLPAMLPTSSFKSAVENLQHEFINTDACSLCCHRYQAVARHSRHCVHLKQPEAALFITHCINAAPPAAADCFVRRQCHLLEFCSSSRIKITGTQITGF